jgi:DNA-binding NarL/FixJ family response regulator
VKAAGSRERIRILIVDDQALFATSLKLVLENSRSGDFEVVGIAANGVECIRKVNELHPDLVLLDVYMPEMDGVQAAAAIHRDHPEIKIVMLTTFDDDTYVKNALKSGASGYVLKTIDADELANLITTVHKGMVLLPSSVGSRLFEGGEARAAPGAEEGDGVPTVEALQARFPELKPREAEVLRLILQGNSNHQIARTLFIAEQTVRNYTSSIYTKIGVDDRFQAIQLLRGPK